MPHTGESTPVAATKAGSAEKALRTQAMACGSSSVSPSTVSTVSAVICNMAAFSATAFPPCGKRSQRKLGCVALAALIAPGSGSAKLYSCNKTAAVLSVEPSSAITISSGGSS